MMVQNLSAEQAEGVVAWLGLESVRLESDELFQLAKTLALVVASYHAE